MKLPSVKVRQALSDSGQLEIPVMTSVELTLTLTVGNPSGESVSLDLRALEKRVAALLQTILMEHQLH